MQHKHVKRKAAKGRKDRKPIVKVEETVYEKRPVFLEGHYSHGWTKHKGENHGRFDVNKIGGGGGGGGDSEDEEDADDFDDGASKNDEVDDDMDDDDYDNDDDSR